MPDESPTLVEQYTANETNRRLFTRERAREQVAMLLATQLHDQDATCAGLARQLGWSRARVQRVLDGDGAVPDLADVLNALGCELVVSAVATSSERTDCSRYCP